MCLSYAHKVKQKGEITCYKILAKTAYPDIAVSPFQEDYTWCIGRVQEALFDENTKPNTIIKSDGAIRSGAFHSFKSIKDAEEYFNTGMIPYKPYDLYLAECVIPKDNKYLYEGDVYVWTKAKYLDGYASQKLKVVKFIPMCEKEEEE